MKKHKIYGIHFVDFAGNEKTLFVLNVALF